MGAFSEMNIDQMYSDSPFSGGRMSSAPAKLETPAWVEPMQAAPDGIADGDCQPVEPVPAGVEQLNESGSAQAIPQDAGSGSEPNEDAEEEAKRTAHEAAEAQRKADWEARQRQKKAAMQEQLNRLAAMSDNEVAMAAMKRVSADTEKLTRRSMKDCVSEHIQTLCLDDPAFARRVGHPGKRMVNCFRYINRRAWDYIQDELKTSGSQPGPGREMYGTDVPDGLCYQWAVDYFNDPDAKEDQVEEETFVPRPYLGKTVKSKNKGKAKPKKEAVPKHSDTQKAEAKKAVDAGQIAMGDFTMPEEAAG